MKCLSFFVNDKQRSKYAFKSEKVTLQEHSNLTENKSISLVHSCQQCFHKKKQLTAIVICQAVGYLSKLSCSFHTSMFFCLVIYVIFGGCLQIAFVVTIQCPQRLILLIKSTTSFVQLTGVMKAEIYLLTIILSAGVRKAEFASPACRTGLYQASEKGKFMAVFYLELALSVCYFSMGLLVSREKNW